MPTFTWACGLTCDENMLTKGEHGTQLDNPGPRMHSIPHSARLRMESVMQNLQASRLRSQAFQIVKERTCGRDTGATGFASARDSTTALRSAALYGDLRSSSWLGQETGHNRASAITSSRAQLLLQQSRAAGMIMHRSVFRSSKFSWPVLVVEWPVRPPHSTADITVEPDMNKQHNTHKQRPNRGEHQGRSHASGRGCSRASHGQTGPGGRGRVRAVFAPRVDIALSTGKASGTLGIQPKNEPWVTRTTSRLIL